MNEIFLEKLEKSGFQKHFHKIKVSETFSRCLVILMGITVDSNRPASCDTLKNDLNCHVEFY